TVNPHVSVDAGWYLAQTGGSSDARFGYLQTVLQW
ncbi:MAG: hypothetical protein RIQ93_3103, partial [Verrucomicrobiota bacterium]